jgi:hypothetical protein
MDMWESWGRHRGEMGAKDEAKLWKKFPNNAWESLDFFQRDMILIEP